MKDKYERMYYLIGPYDIVYGRFPKFREAKNHLLDMARSSVRLHELKPGIYKSCEQPASEYESSSIKFHHKPGAWKLSCFSC